MPTKKPTLKLTPKKAASRQSDLLIMAVLGLVVVGAAVIIWQSYQLDVLESSYQSQGSAALRGAKMSAPRLPLAAENDALLKRLDRWNENSMSTSPQGDLLASVLVKSGFPQQDTLLWNFEILRVGKILDDAKTPYAIMTISDGTQDRGLFVAKRVGVRSDDKATDNYEYVPDTFRMVSNYAHQTIQNVRWSASKQVGYEILTKVEGPNPNQVEKMTIDIQE